MEKKERIINFALSDDFVSINVHRYIVDDNGVELDISIPNHTYGYPNSFYGREQLLKEQPACKEVETILSHWGDIPTKEDPQPEIPFESLPEQGEIEAETEVEPVESQEAVISEIAEEKPKRSRKKKTDEVPIEQEETENTEEQP